MKLGIDALDIVQINGLVEEHLVEGRGEPDIPRFSSDSRGALFANDIVAVEKHLPAVDVVTVEDGNGNDAADEVKIAEMILIYRRIWINLNRRKSKFSVRFELSTIPYS